MVETVIKHLTEFKQLTEAAIPFRLLNEKGERNCARAAEKIIKNQVADVVPSLREETLLYLMENPEAIDCLGKLKKEEDSLNMERFQKILSNVENDKLSDIGYEQMKKIYFDPMIPDEAAYHYMKYYGKLDVSLEEKEQLVNSLTMCIGELDFDRAGEKGRMLLFQPVFSSDLLLGLLEKPKTIESLEDPELLKLVNTLAGYKAGIEPLNQNQFDQLREKPGEILEKKQVVTRYIPKDLLSYGLQLWLWNGALYADLCKLERIFMDGMGASEVFKSRVSYVNTLYQNPLSGIDLSGLSYKKSELLLYAITQKKKNFLRLIQKEKMLFDDLPDNSLLLEESVYLEYLNLNTVNKKNLKESADLILPRRQFHDLKKRMYTFEELKLLCRAEKTVICLYGQLTCMRIDDQICVLRELLKRKCMPRTFQDGQLGILAKALSIKPLSRWIREDFGNIRGLSYETAVWLLVYQEQLKGMEKEITMEEQVFYLLKNLELIKECGSFWELKEKLIMRDISWGVLKEKLTFSEDFVKTNATRIGEFIFAGGAEVIATYLKQQPSKKEEIRRLVVAELLGKFEKLKYPAGDLSREIDFAVSKEVELEWEKDLTYICGDLTLQEETRLLPIMQIGEIPTYSCISYRTGSNSHCLLSCFDSNKKFLFIPKNGQVVFRAMLRLTKGSYADDMHRKKIQFADLSNLDETKDEEGEELVLFLERYYEKNLSCEELDAAVNLAIETAKEKANKLGARFVLSTYYQYNVRTNEYIKSSYYLYISKSKNGSQYLDSLFGSASVTDSGCYGKNLFLMENKSKRAA